MAESVGRTPIGGQAIEKRQLNRRAEQSFDAVQAARENDRRCGLRRAGYGNVDRQWLAVRDLGRGQAANVVRSPREERQSMKRRLAVA